MTHPLPEALARDLTRIVGEGAVITETDRLLSYESDGLTAYRAAPAAAVLPADTGQVRAVLAALHRAGVAVVPRGAGTGLSGGAVAASGGVVVGTARMNRILELDADNRRARVQAGTINARLSEAARPHGLLYVPDPSSQSACTLGGNVAENSGGPHCLKYGVTSRYVSGLTLVLADGEVAELGPRGSGGLDLVGVAVGSEGCFGLVTEIEVELLPVPEGVRTLLAVFDEIEDAGRAVTAIIAGGLLPAALEIVDRETIRAVESSVYAAGYPVGAAAALVVEFDGMEAGLDDEVGKAEACCRRAGAREVRRARDASERTALWKGRKKAFGAMGRVAPDLMVQDATVPRSRLPRVLGRIGEIARRYDLTVANVFHAGDGNLHPNILFDRRDAEQLERVERASREMMEVCVEAGGTITGEHGVGLDKRRYMSLVHGPAELSAMADVKAVFDPGGRLNPGKVLPDGVEPSGAPAASGSPSPGGARPPEPSAAPRLRELLGEEAVTWEGTSERPVVTPRSTEEVAAVLEAAHAAGWRVLPRGAGLEAVSAGSSADAGHLADVVLSTAALRSVPAYEPADLTITAGAGVTLASLAERTGAEGQWLPLDPPGPDTATLGGALATGLGGSLAGAFGWPRDLVLGLTCVTGDGRILRLGGRVVKNVAGFDLVKLLVGSRGRLGVITEATVRLFPLPQADRVLVARAPRAEELAPGARALAPALLLPGALELGEDEEGARLVVRLLGSAAAVDEQVRRLRAAEPRLAVADADEGAELLRSLRAVGCGDGVGVRIGVPPVRLGAALEAVRELAGALGGEERTVRGRMAVHAGRGVLRWSASAGGAGPADVWRRPFGELERWVAREGGTFRVTGVPEGWSDSALGVPRPDGLVAGDGSGAAAAAGRPGPAVPRLEDGLMARFDPGSVLSRRSAGVAAEAGGAR